MHLKRLFDHSSGEPVITGVEVKHTGVDAEQHFSTRLVAAGVAGGWITITGETMTMKAQPEPLVFKILRRPGYYCCFDKSAIPMPAEAWMEPSLAAAVARAYLKAKGFSGESPDPSNPAGYGRSNQWDVLLSAEQHAKYKAGA